MRSIRRSPLVPSGRAGWGTSKILRGAELPSTGATNTVEEPLPPWRPGVAALVAHKLVDVAAELETPYATALPSGAGATTVASWSIEPGGVIWAVPPLAGSSCHSSRPGNGRAGQCDLAS